MTDQRMGHGVKQRDVIKMSKEEVDAFLAERRAMTMSTIAPDGTIHSVAMWYGLVDGAPVFETKGKSQKVKNLTRDPRITCMVEDGDYYEELRGVELVGEAEVIDDPEYLRRVGISVFERYHGGWSDEMEPMLQAMLNKRVAVKVNVHKVVSWDHRKLGLPSTRPAVAE